MGFLINNNQDPGRYTSIDGKFHNGMTLDDAKKKDVSTQIIFSTIDTSKDNKLSGEEIIARRKEELSMMDFSLSLLQEQYMRLIEEDREGNKDKILELDAKIVELEEKIIQETTLTEMYEEELAKAQEENEAGEGLLNMNNFENPKKMPNCDFLG